uniref:Uncharacterized protein n=1 Tax=Inkyuleea mariana TaxID=123988 RepID=A0A4D6X796_9FLOR|nr:hypothetical protein [Inkyuleea mariana]
MLFNFLLIEILNYYIAFIGFIYITCIIILFIILI